MLFSAALQALGGVPLLYLPGVGFEPIGEEPEWLQALCPPERPIPEDTFPFLECLVSEFEEGWGMELGTPASGPWIEERSGRRFPLQAQGLWLDSQRIVLLRHLGADYEEQQAILQRARNNALVHEALEREISKKDYLLHCIMHDLVGPLTCIKGALHILNRVELTPEKAKAMLSMCIRQTDRQEAMIREVLEVFAAEMKALTGRRPETTVELHSVYEQVIAGLTPAYQESGVELALLGPSLTVLAEAGKLERILSNLLENALRNVPKGSRVAVTVSQQDDFALTEILDDGPGVPESVIGQLFKKLSQGKSGGGKIGLGLYFCKITVESWGGSIGYSTRPEGGANFWYRLPLVPPRPGEGEDGKDEGAL